MAQALPALQTIYEGPSIPTIEIQLRIRVASGSDSQLVDGIVISVASDGAVCQAPVALPIGAEVKLQFRFIGKRSCEAYGQVSWHRDGRFRVAFTGRNEQMDSFLSQLYKLTAPLRPIYLADILEPLLTVTDG